MSRLRPAAIAITLASVVAAGAIAQFRDGEVADEVTTATLGEVVAVSDGQSLKVVSLASGTFFRGEFNGNRGMSTGGRFLQVTFTASTERARGITSMRCELQTRTGGTIHPISLPRVSFPQSGFALTQALLWEVATDDLEGAVVSCIESSVLAYREVEVRAGLGLTGDAVEAMVQRSATTELRPVTESLAVTR